jgi:hypothetical protein
MLFQLELIQLEAGRVATGRLAFLLRVYRFPFDLLRWSLADAMGMRHRNCARNPEKFIIARDTRQRATNHESSGSLHADLQIRHMNAINHLKFAPSTLTGYY